MVAGGPRRLGATRNGIPEHASGAYLNPDAPPRSQGSDLLPLSISGSHNWMTGFVRGRLIDVVPEIDGGHASYWTRKAWFHRTREAWFHRAHIFHGEIYYPHVIHHHNHHNRCAFRPCTAWCDCNPRDLPDFGLRSDLFPKHTVRLPNGVTMNNIVLP